MLEPKAAGADAAAADRAVRRAPALGRAPRVEDLKAAIALVERQVRVPEEDRVGAGKPPPQAGEAPASRPGVVDQRDPDALRLDRPLGWQLAPELGVVDVAVDREDRPAERFELGEHGPGAEVAEVDDSVGRAKLFHAPLRQAARPLRKMRVGDDRQAHA